MSAPIRLVLLLVTNMVALWVAEQVVSGFKIDHVWPTLVVAGAVLGVLDFFVKPILKLFALPFILLTLGLMLMVINAAILGLMALFVSGVSISGFIPALEAAVIVSIVSWVMITVLGLKG
jgi:putative membrane protein